MDISKMKEDGKLNINEKMLHLIEFPPAFYRNEVKESKEHQVVASVYSKKVIVGALKSIIAKLPPDV